MKLITVALRPALLEMFRDAVGLFGVRGFTVSRAYGGSPAPPGLCRGDWLANDFRPLLKIELVTLDDEAPDLVHVISRITDGAEDTARRIRISDVLVFCRIRSGAYGADAL